MPWHIGLAVPDLDAGLQHFGDLFGVTWRPVRQFPVRINGGDGAAYDIRLRVTFSLTSPFALEIWEAIPGTPMAAPEGTMVHHVGYWADDFDAERDRLTRLGHPPFMTIAATGTSMHRGPGGLGLEPEDVHTDNPWLRDLFPQDSPFFGTPQLNG
jgi:hypothetical protein